MILMVKTETCVRAKAAKKEASTKTWYISWYFSMKADFRAFRKKTPPEDGGFPCHICGKVCRAYIGLQSHLRAHQRRGGDRAVVVALDGPP